MNEPIRFPRPIQDEPEYPLYLSPEAAARHLGVSRAQIYRLMQAGMPWHRVRGLRRIRTRELIEWVEGGR